MISAGSEFQYCGGELRVVMDGTMGTGTFKSEKNLVFFQDKKSRYP